MTQFYFQQGLDGAGLGTLASPWSQAGFDAAVSSGAFRVGGADALAIITGGTNTLSISATNANLTPITGVGGPTIVTLTTTVITDSLSVDLRQIAGANPIEIRNNNGIQYFSVATGASLLLNASQATAATITGVGTVAVSNLQSSLAADFSNITTSVFTASGVLTANAGPFTGSLGKALVTLTSADATPRTFTVLTPTLQGAGGSISVGNGATLASTAGSISDFSGVTASTTGTGVIALADLNGTANLSGLTGNVSAVVAGNYTFTGNLGAIRPTVNTGFTLTIANDAATRVGNAQFNGAGRVLIAADVAGPISNLSVFTTGLNSLTFNSTTDKNIATGSGNDFITTTTGRDYIASGAGNDTIDAGGGNNVIRSGAGFDSVTTGAGDDYIEGGGGNDTVDAGNGANYVTDSGGVDSITTGNGRDTILSGDGNDTIASGLENDSVGAGAGNDSVTAGAGDDTVIGGGGNDTLNGGAGIDSLSGGDGDDTFLVQDNLEQVNLDVIAAGTGVNAIVLDGGAGVPVEAQFDFDNISDVLAINNANGLGSNRTVTFSEITETVAQQVVLDASTLTTGILSVTNNAVSATTTFNLAGGGGNDILSGSNGNDTLTGGAGTDSLTGGAGNDSVTGGVGDDTLVAGAGVDTLDGGTNIDTLILGQGASGTLIANSTAISLVVTTAQQLSTGNTIAFSNIESIVATSQLNGAVGLSLTGSDAANTITGGSGVDSIFGGDGADSITGGASNDNFTGGAGNDTFNADAGIDAVLDFGVGSGDEIIVAVGVTATVTVGAQNTVTATSTNSGVLNVSTAAGTQLTAANTISFAALGGSAGITLNASTQTTNGLGLIGSARVDVITGGGGGDTITGGELADNLTGGAGIDSFVYTAVTGNFINTNRDTITDFTQGAGGDVLRISAAGFTGLTAGQVNTFANVAGSANLATSVLVDTTANLLAAGASLPNTRLAYDTTLNQWFNDSNGDWATGSVSFASSTNALTALGLVAANVIIA